MDLSGGDLRPPKQPDGGNAEMGVRPPRSATEAGDGHTLTKLDRKKGEKEKDNGKENKKMGEKERMKNEKDNRKKAKKERENNEKENKKMGEKERMKNEKDNRKKAKKERENYEKENRKKGEKEKVKKEKEIRKERRSGGWRLRTLKRAIFRCFVCGGGDDMSQYEWEFSPEEERLWIEESIRRNREADLQRLLKVQEVNRKHKENFKCMLRRRKFTEANKEWSALPPRPEEEEADRKVTFREVNAGDLWFYQEEANPRGLAWKRVLRDIKDNDITRALQAKWLKKEKHLSEEKQLIIANQKEEEKMDLFCELLTASVLCLGFAVLLYIWLSRLLQ
ncbi:cilia- and flagella-associated protein 45-like [Engraulis encrasicolus]|uniref:cilia- and flagella-associated protein 45-like n=1 Tax=Engraulis encrasicolus TaxID=184585 RepID=UPI002FD136FB